MNKTKMTYFEKEDILHLAISEEPESTSLELSPNITGELNSDGELIGIEILRKCQYLHSGFDFRVRSRKNTITHRNPIHLIRYGTL